MRCHWWCSRGAPCAATTGGAAHAAAPLWLHVNPAAPSGYMLTLSLTLTLTLTLTLPLPLPLTQVPWKLMFAIVPPPGMCGGFPCFFGALFMIGVQVHP